MLKIILPSLSVFGMVIGIFMGANLLAYLAYTSSYKEYQEKNEILDKTLQKNSEALELSEYIKSHYPKIYKEWVKSKTI